jgi:hypothetical protein
MAEPVGDRDHINDAARHRSARETLGAGISGAGIRNVTEPLSARFNDWLE